MCLALGFPHPDYLKPLLSSRQLTDWHAYSELEPWGPLRDDERAGQVCATLYNINRTKEAPTLEWFQFLCNVRTPTDAPVAEVTPEQSFRALNVVVQAAAERKD
jgi:hypothetical protein